MLATLSKLSLMDPNLPTGIIGKSFAEVQAIRLVPKLESSKLDVHQLTLTAMELLS